MKHWKTTFGGLLIALATAWATVDFSSFTWSKDWYKLVLPAMLAIGGILMKDPKRRSLNQKAKGDH